MSFGRPPTFSSFKATAPDRGSFPLDHDGECRAKMQVYLSCLESNENNSEVCRVASKDYLSCRMSSGLMQNEEWKNLGLADVGSNKDTACTTCTRQQDSK